MTKGSLGDIKSLHFTTILSVQHARNHERVAMVSRRIRVLPQFWASDTHETTRGLPWSAEEFAFYHSFERPTRPKWRKGRSGRCKNSRFTTVLNVRHVRSDERVDPRAQKFAFYHSFERPTRPKWWKGRSATSKICVLPQFWASDTHEVARGLSNPQVRSLRPRQKRIDFKTFSEDFD